MWKPAVVIVLAMGLVRPQPAQAQDPPPAKVVVATVEAGTLAPTAEFQGSTVYFKEVSEVATEMNGKVLEVLFDDGEHLKQGQPMMRLDSELAEAALAVARAMHRQSESQLAQERARLERADILLVDEVTTPQQHDDIKFIVEALGHQVAAAKAEADRLALEVSKKTTYAPYDGIVLDRNTEVGEWKQSGDSVAVFARAALFDVIANVPESQLAWIRPETTAEILVNDQHIQGRVVTVIPRGDVATRTFPVKIRITGQEGLMEGMSAQVTLPVGQKQECLLVPRDAVMLSQGRPEVVVVSEGTARRLPVTILGHEGEHAGIEADGVQAGMQVIVKGHERVREGQPIEIVP